MRQQFQIVFYAVIALGIVLNTVHTIRVIKWHVLLPIAFTVATATSVVYGLRARLALSPPAKRLLDLVDYRYRTCATFRTVALQLSKQLRAMNQAPIQCDDVVKYLDLPRFTIALPALALKATSAGSLLSVQSFVKAAAQEQCASDGTVYPAEVADEIDRAAAQVCAVTS